MYKPKTKEEYISLCRYYRGEECCPDGVNNLFWDYEQLWVEKHFEVGGVEFLQDLIKGYKAVGLGSYMVDDGTPIAIKAILWCRYEHWTEGTPGGFRGWYKREYLNMVPLNSEK